MMLSSAHYCITTKNLAAHELIGLQAKVVYGTDAGRKGIEGKVVDETRNVIVMESKGVEKMVPKAECVFEFDVGGEKSAIEGRKIMYAPEARTKMVYGRNMHG
ncbi:MAG: ribonuclease P protein component 1 [Candidatus Diapherotrites archaeon]|uniref:Ribonuclease P protein component 1 n=1 Tax=Candidatus Iainarchaeum sp. TaxID=3101447 RepID=A0A8T3YMJ9_9ARCH|nr:ribonuclease P protein component 1 [Candidatus Diapherotrites archaeon]